MSTPEDIRVATAIAKAETQVQADIQNYITNCIPDAGEILCRCPLFKAGKPISKYATIADETHPDVETSWKEVVVTTNWSVKLDIRLVPSKEKDSSATQADNGDDSSPPPQQKEAKKIKPAKTKILTEWISPLSSVASVVPHIPATASDKERGAEFCVLFLGNKDIKQDKDKSKVNYRDDSLRYLAPHHAALAKESIANRLESVQKEMDAIEQLHLDHLSRDLKFPSLRCRAYVVPEALGGAATRDKWVDTYRTAVFNSWRARVRQVYKMANEHDDESHPEGQITCVRFAEVTFSTNAEVESQVPVENDDAASGEDASTNENKNDAQHHHASKLCAVMTFEDHACLIVPVVECGFLMCTARSLHEEVSQNGLYVPSGFNVSRPDPFAPFRIRIARSEDVSANLEFFTNAHADAFMRCVENVDGVGMVTSFSI